MTVDLLDGRLDAVQVESYWADGFLHPINVLDAEVAATARADLEKVGRNFLTRLTCRMPYTPKNASTPM